MNQGAARSRYSEEFKEQAVQKMTPPHAMSVVQVSRDTGVSEQTL
ncbi:MAG: transposase [Parahaliea sp.]